MKIARCMVVLVAAGVALALSLGGSCAPLGTRRAAASHHVDLAELLAAHPEEFSDIVDRAAEVRLKIELAVVVPGATGERLELSSFDAGPAYFYPASSIKTCAVLAALHDADVLGIDGKTPLRYAPLFDGEAVEEADPTDIERGVISLAHDAAMTMIVSDNKAFNRLYEFTGAAGIERLFRDAGWPAPRIVHRLSEFRGPLDQLRFPRIDAASRGAVAGTSGVFEPLLALRQEEPRPPLSMEGLLIGEAHWSGGGVVPGPMDFAGKNFAELRELLLMNVAILRPDLLDSVGRGHLAITPRHRRLVTQLMTVAPQDSGNPVFEAEDYAADDYKFLAPGVRRVIPEAIVRDKVGRAYGFSVTNSHVILGESGPEFFLAATLYSNENGIVGDGVYGYDRADRFMADLGEVVARALVARTR